MGHALAAFLLQHEVADLGAVAVGDDNPVGAREPGDLLHRNLKVGKLLANGAALVFANQSVAAQGDQQGGGRHFIQVLYV